MAERLALPTTDLYCRSDRVAERSALPTMDHGVSGSSPAGGEIISEPKRPVTDPEGVHGVQMNPLLSLNYLISGGNFRKKWSDCTN